MKPYESDALPHNPDILMFFDGHQNAWKLYESFETMLYGAFPAVSKHVRKTQISFSNRNVFACVSFARIKRKADLPDGYMVITLGLPEPLNSDRVAVKTEPYPGRWTHHIIISKPEDLDHELLSWISEAYVFAAARKRRL